MRAFSSAPHDVLMRAVHRSKDVKPLNLTRASLALLVLVALAAGVGVGNVLSALRGGEEPSTPVSSPAAPSPSVDDLPPADVSGADLTRLPRYPGSIRSEYGIDASEGFRLTAVEYLAAAHLDDVRAFYQGVIGEFGWQRADIGYSAGEWTYLLVDGTTEALVELEIVNDLVEIDLQVSEPIATPAPVATPTPAITPPPPSAAPPQQPAPPQPGPPQPAPPPGDDDGDDGDDDDGSDD